MQCPYDGGHLVDAKSFNSHVSSCRVAFSGPLIQCKFNARHWIPMPEVAYHSKMCADRQLYLMIEATLQCEPVPLQRETEMVDVDGAGDEADATAPAAPPVTASDETHMLESH
uniref:CHHC U11-48K-type domain-containing protein n=1 Tax=Plectus sambesii TaxID=2011161 RepID=A0A914XKE1_9BILA